MTTPIQNLSQDIYDLLQDLFNGNVVPELYENTSVRPFAIYKYSAIDAENRKAASIELTIQIGYELRTSYADYEKLLYEVNARLKTKFNAVKIEHNRTTAQSANLRVDQSKYHFFCSN